jgi:hypothetical protein
MRKSKRFQCPWCEFHCGRSRMFEEHIKSKHGHESIQQAYVYAFLGGSIPKCACNVCSEVPKFNGWNHGFSKFVIGHNGNIYTAYPEEKAQSISDKRKEKLMGREGWSRGLTKETDERIKKRSAKISKTRLEMSARGELPTWSKGLTKETDERLKKHANNLTEGYQAGRYVPWAKGLTKETDERVYKMSQSVSAAHRKKGLRNRLDALKRLNPNVIRERLNQGPQNLQLITDLSEYTRDRHVNLEFVCRQCKKMQTKSLIQAMSGRCDYCSPLGSRAQLEIFEFAKSLDCSTRINDRTIIDPQEIDIVLPKHKLGLEYNGLYFHSDVFKSRQYHSAKSKEAIASGYRLMHVFEDEWRDKKEIIKSMIRHRCNQSPIRTAARKCSIIALDSQQRRDFFEMNHIDGDTKASQAWGLIDVNGSIACALSIRRPMHRRYKGMFEIARFASSLNTSVSGGLSRLFSHASKQNPNVSWITYVDTRLGSHIDHLGYTSCGFRPTKLTPPRFWWTDGRTRINRFKVRAVKEEGLTEKEVANQLGVVKIWGCQNILLERSV